MCIVFHDARVGFSVNVRDIESAITAHLAPQGSYRAPGTGGGG
ncbi:Hypothetical protein A7982_10382 [Minicystis rosea]|nr:Hypothetical protein A7982_10382 [Minicystis rosea]